MAHTPQLTGERIPTLAELSNDAILLRTEVVAARVTGSAEVYDLVIAFIDQLQAALHSPDRRATRSAGLTAALATDEADC